MWYRIKPFHFSCKAELTSAASIWKKELFYFNYRGLPFNRFFFFQMSSVGWYCPFCAVFLASLRANSAIVQPKNCSTHFTRSISNICVFIWDHFLQGGGLKAAPSVHSLIRKRDTKFWNRPSLFPSILLSQK